ncbi:MAG: DUF4382 domain-containing protein [Desulfobacterales bacterium]|jgi:hypothetical protein
MIKFKGLLYFILLSTVTFLAACGGGGGSGRGGTGTLSMSVTDAKPMLPDGVTNLFVTFDEVRVHKSGGGWTSLPLVESPYTIDLLQFQDGNVTELVPPTKLESGKYTQVRLVVSGAKILFDNISSTAEEPVRVPSGNLKTDKNFIFNVGEDAAVDLIVHFDLSKSVVVTGPAANPSYKLKPVLHLFDDPLEAATIKGSIENSAFGDSEKATVTVIAESNQEEYTIVEVSESDTEDPTEFTIFWLVPYESYTVEIDLDQNDTTDYDEFVQDIDLPKGAEFELNDGDPIS